MGVLNWALSAHSVRIMGVLNWALSAHSVRIMGVLNCVNWALSAHSVRIMGVLNWAEVDSVEVEHQIGSNIGDELIRRGAV